MTVQTSVALNLAVALAGDVRGDDPICQTRVTTVVSNGGLAMCQASGGDDRCRLPASSSDVAKLRGVARSDVSRDPNFPPGGTPGYTYQIGDSVDLVYRGQVWVTVEDAVAPDDPAYVRHTSDGASNTQLGSWRGDADTGPSPGYVDRAALVTGARYLTTASAGGLALLDLNLPQ